MSVLEQLLKEFAEAKGYQLVQRASDPTTPTTQSVYGGQGLFNTCVNTQLINASVSQPGIGNWLNWRPSTARLNEMGVLTFMGRDPDAGAYTHPDGACEDCEDTSTFTTCDWCFEFGRYCEQGNTLDIADTGLRPCERYPQLRLLGALTDDLGNVLEGGAQGIPISNDFEWTMMRNGRALATVVADQLWNGTGAGTAPNVDMVGLTTLVNTIWEERADCPGVEPDVKNFQNTCIGDQYGGFSICDYLQEVVDQIWYRANAGLNALPQSGEIGIWAPPNIARELLQEWDCCRAQRCEPAAANNTVFISSADVMEERDRRYRTGAVTLFGVVTMDQGIQIPVYADHHIPSNRVGNQEFGDIYILTKSVAGIPVLWGEYQDFRRSIPANIIRNYTEYDVTDDGRFLHVYQSRNVCISVTTYVKPRIIMHGPYLQGRIANVCAESLQSLPDPEDTYGGDNVPAAVSCDTLVS